MGCVQITVQYDAKGWFVQLLCTAPQLLDLCLTRKSALRRRLRAWYDLTTGQVSNTVTSLLPSLVLCSNYWVQALAVRPVWAGWVQLGYVE